MRRCLLLFLARPPSRRPAPTVTMPADPGAGPPETALPRRPRSSPSSFSGRGPYAVGEVDLALDDDHQVAVFYPVDPDAVPADAEPYSYSGDTIFGPDDLEPPARGSVRRDHHPGHLRRRPGQRRRAVPRRAPQPRLLRQPPLRQPAQRHRRLVGLRGGRRRPSRAGRGVDPGVLHRRRRGRASRRVPRQRPAGRRPRPAGRVRGRLADTVDTEQVAAEGHSAGGSASGTAAYDDRVDLWIGQAPGTPLAPDTDLEAFTDDGGEGLDTAALLEATEPPPVPSMIIAAEGDTIVDLDRVQADLRLARHAQAPGDHRRERPCRLRRPLPAHPRGGRAERLRRGPRPRPGRGPAGGAR